MMIKKAILSAAVSFGLAASTAAASALDGAYTMDFSGTGAQTITPSGTTFSSASGNYEQFTMTFIFDCNSLVAAYNAATESTSVKGMETAYNGNSNKLGVGFKVTVSNAGKTLQAVAQAGNNADDKSPSADLSTLIGSTDKLVLTLVYNGSSGTTLYTYNPLTDTIAAGATATTYKYKNHNHYNSFWVTNNSWAKSAESVYVFDTAKTNTTDLLAISKAAYLEAIPEPATATLSLLALAGLAARRRRK